MYRTKTIAVDHGNRNIKTENQIFTSGLVESDTEPPLGTSCLITRSIIHCHNSGFLT